MNVPRKALAVYALFSSLLLSGCGAGQVFGPTVTPTPSITYMPTLTPTPSATFTPTVTSTPTATFIPTATPTREIKQFNICTPENFRDCPITEEDLTSGDYWRWLNTLSKPFDPAKVKDVSLEFNPMGKNIQEIVYNIKTAPNFNIKGSEPFRRDVTAAFLQTTTPDVGKLDHAILPIEFKDENDPNISHWVVTINSLFYQKLDIAKELNVIKTWRDKMNYTVILTSDKIPDSGNIIDPIVRNTFIKYPDMEERFDRFVKGDMSALSEPGIVVANDIAWTPPGYPPRYK